MKRGFISGIIVAWLSMGVFYGALANEKAVAAVPNAAPEYTDAVNSFLAAKRSDNPQRNYSSCIETFSKIAKTTDNPELRIRSKYFLAFALFLQRDFTNAKLYAKEVLNLGQPLCKENPFAVLAGSMSDKLDNDEVTFTEAQSAVTAQKAGEAALLMAELLRYSQATDSSMPEPVKVKAESLYPIVTTLSLYALIFNLPMDATMEKVRQAECVSRLHELIAKWRKYCQDHNGKFVPLSVQISNTGKGWVDTATWVNLMQAYIADPELKNVQPRSGNILLTSGGPLACPSFVGANVESCCPHYGMNHMILGKENGGWDSLDEMPAPEQTVIFMDAKRHYVIGPTWGLQFIDFRHSDGVNCAFADGHVDWLPRSEIEKSSKSWSGCAPWQPKNKSDTTK